MQFIVPQFIDVEDKIIGPISVRQFVTLLVGAAIIFANYQVGYKIIFGSFWLFAISSIVIFAVSGTFAFLRINGRPFHYFLLNVLTTLQKPTLRVWNKRLTKAELTSKEEEVELTPPTPVKGPLTARKLTELSLIVDTGGAYHEELREEAAAPPKEQATAPKDIFESSE